MASSTITATAGLPDPPEERSITFENLSGGLNLWELPYRMDADQSPDMENLWWRDGLLSCRDGQTYVSEALAKGSRETYDIFLCGSSACVDEMGAL